MTFNIQNPNLTMIFAKITKKSTHNEHQNLDKQFSNVGYTHTASVGYTQCSGHTLVHLCTASLQTALLLKKDRQCKAERE